MKIRIIQIGKNKDEYVNETVSEFIKRISPYAKIEIVTLKGCSISKTVTEEQCIAREGKQILSVINDDDFVIALDERGKQFTSPDFAVALKEWLNTGSKLVFVIGGPWGLTIGVGMRANLLLSFSKMTFTHQIIRVFLLEQIYRGFCIIHNKEYHH